MVESSRKTEGREGQGHQSPRRYPSWLKSAAVWTILCGFAGAVGAYLSFIATTEEETVWAYSILLFVLMLGICRKGGWLCAQGYHKSRTVQAAVRLLFYATSGLVVGATTYQFGGAEAALFTGVMWFVLMVFLPLLDI